MKRFSALAWRNLRARRLRVLLTGLGVVLGVGLVFGVLLLSNTLLKSFEDLFDSVYGNTDLVVGGEGQSGSGLSQSALDRVRRVEGVEQAQGSVFAVLVLVQPNGKTKQGQAGQVNTVGVDPEAPDFSGARTVAGRDIRSGQEIRLQERFAKDNGVQVGDRVRLATPAGVSRFKVVGLFQFSTGLDFGGQGFATIPLAVARRVLDKPRGFDEVDVSVEDPGAVQDVRRRLRTELGRGIIVETPESKSDEIASQLQGLNVVLYFFAGMALFVGGFLIFNAFNMTVLQRMRELGMLRTLGASRGMIARSVLTEALILALGGSLVGLAGGVGLAELLVALVRAIGVPIGGLELTPLAALAALVVGVGVTLAGALYPARRAGRVPPLRAVLGAAEGRGPPRPRRALYGAVMIGAGLAGVFVLASSTEAPPPVAAAGIGGTIFLFCGVFLVAPFVIPPLVRALSWPIRLLAPVGGRLASDSARANPGRTAATASGLMIGLALVTAFGTLGSSFLGSVSDELDRNFARDLTVQPVNFQPGAGPQQTFSPALARKIAKLPEAEVVTAQRFSAQHDLLKGKEGLAFSFDPEAFALVDNTEFAERDRQEVFADVERGQVTLGRGMAKLADVELGGRVTLRGPSGTRRARVAGIVETSVYGGATVGMSHATMRKVYGIGRDSQLAIKARLAAGRAALERRVEQVVSEGYPQLQVLSNDELKSEIETQVNEQFSVFYLILAVAILVSLLGVVNTLSMNVLERTREIGVLRALGSSRWQVRWMITDESLLLTLIGTLLGLVVGVALGWVFLEGARVTVPSVRYYFPGVLIAVVVIAGLVLGLLAAILPARRAARMNIIEAVGYE